MPSFPQKWFNFVSILLSADVYEIPEEEVRCCVCARTRACVLKDSPVKEEKNYSEQKQENNSLWYMSVQRKEEYNGYVQNCILYIAFKDAKHNFHLLSQNGTNEIHF